MDPDANLARQRELAEEILQHRGKPPSDLAEELAALAYSLDEWLARGGFLPRAWRQAPSRVVHDPELGR